MVLNFNTMPYNRKPITENSLGTACKACSAVTAEVFKHHLARDRLQTSNLWLQFTNLETWEISNGAP